MKFMAVAAFILMAAHAMNDALKGIEPSWLMWLGAAAWAFNTANLIINYRVVRK